MALALSLCVTARDAAARLGFLLAEARLYADEIVVGVDRASVDETWDVAVAGADRVFGFRQRCGAGPARLAGLERARGDWILFLDDDEGMDAAFPQLRDELVGEPSVTHWLLNRKWVTSMDPPQYIHAVPWHPGESVRLVRNDPTRVWKPRAVHSGLWVIGPGAREHRTAILHYEWIDRSASEREAKLRSYRARGQDDANEIFYTLPPGAPLRSIEPPPLRGQGRIRGTAHSDADTDQLDERPDFPGWAATVEVDVPQTAVAGERIVLTGRARNDGTLRWVPPSASGFWPRLGLGVRTVLADGTLADRGVRAAVGREVPPGGTAHFEFVFEVPADAGEHIHEWQMVSELEYWFTELGSRPVRTRLTVLES